MKFYKLNNAMKRSSIELRPNCKQYKIGEFIGPNSILLLNNDFGVVKGNKWFDLIPFYGDPINFIISHKMKTLFKENNISGWDCFEIYIDKYSEKKYYVFQITSREAGKIINLDELNNYEDDYIKFDESTWDGSDFFTLKNTGITACTKKVKDLLGKNNITNVEISVL